MARFRATEDLVCPEGCLDPGTTPGCDELDDGVYVKTRDGDCSRSAGGKGGAGVLGKPVSACVVVGVMSASASKASTLART